MDVFGELINNSRFAFIPAFYRVIYANSTLSAAPKAAKAKDPRPGRPKGSVNKNRQDVELSPFQTQLQVCIRAALKLTGLDLGIVVSRTTAPWGTMPAYRWRTGRGCPFPES